MDGHQGHTQGSYDLGIVFLIPLGLAAAAYIGATITEKRRGRREWPTYRLIFGILGFSAIAATLVGPLAEQSHTSFTAHMAAHLLVGMLAPLLIVLSAPITLALRTLHVVPARRITTMLNSGPARFLTHPIPAAVFNLGSLWALYATSLSEVMQSNPLLHYLLLVHFFIVGYLFTVSLVNVDPTPHRASFRLRLGVLLVAIAGHSILAKHIYIHPPAGTTVVDAQTGGMLMFYGGDFIELALAAVIFAQWYARSRPAPSLPRGDKGTPRPVA
ncbi:cytochrome c oxidase assembly protein [Arthrobacter flavus]|uniref:Cytochrome c oxidase assembly protein n=1 Tax=Arthrobacter flavus TaxID=95172 RepID=A0ABW4Q3L1_9MICC